MRNGVFMKKVLLGILLITSTSPAFASFICVHGANGTDILASSGGGLAGVVSLEDCQKCITKSKNGFVCFNGQNGMPGLMTEGGKLVFVTTLDECQKAIDTSKP